MKSKIVLSLLLTLLLLVACVPTPSENVIVNKAEGQLESLIAESLPVEQYEIHAEGVPQGEARSLKSILGAPERVTETVKGTVFGGRLVVNIDAEVVVPDVSAVPVYTCELLTPTPAEGEALAAEILGPAPYYEHNGSLWDKARYESEIHKYSMLITEKDDPKDPYGIYGEMRQFTRALDKLQVDETMHPWDGSFADESVTVADDVNTALSYGKGHLGYQTMAAAQFWEGESFPKYLGHLPRTEAERKAVETAAAFLHRLWPTEAEAVSIESKYEEYAWRGHPKPEEPESYRIAFVPKYDGIGTYRFWPDNGSDTAKIAAGVTHDDYSYHYPQEAIGVTVEDGEVVRVEWNCPLRLLQKENANVKLLAFPEIMDIFRKQIFMEYYIDPEDPTLHDGTLTLDVQQIRLSLLRVQKPDSEAYYLLPVWDFLFYWAQIEDQDKDTQWFRSNTLMTINAIDGSRIDRSKGY